MHIYFTQYVLSFHIHIIPYSKLWFYSNIKLVVDVSFSCVREYWVTSAILPRWVNGNHEEGSALSKLRREYLPVIRKCRYKYLSNIVDLISNSYHIENNYKIEKFLPFLLRMSKTVLPDYFIKPISYEKLKPPPQIKFMSYSLFMSYIYIILT